MKSAKAMTAAAYSRKPGMGTFVSTNTNTRGPTVRLAHGANKTSQSYQAEEHNPESGQWSECLRPAGREGQSLQRQ